jgi:hypothetical protein
MSNLTKKNNQLLNVLFFKSFMGLFKFLLLFNMKKLRLLVAPLMVLLFVGVVYATITSNVLQGGGEVQSAPAKLEIIYRTVSYGVVEDGSWNIGGVMGGETLVAEVEVKNDGYSNLVSVALVFTSSWGFEKTYQVGALGVGESSAVNVQFQVPQEGGVVDFSLEATEVVSPPPPSPFLP